MGETLEKFKHGTVIVLFIIFIIMLHVLVIAFYQKVWIFEVPMVMRGNDKVPNKNSLSIGLKVLGVLSMASVVVFWAGLAANSGGFKII
jgi:hypothetical protein